MPALETVGPNEVGLWALRFKIGIKNVYCLVDPISIQMGKKKQILENNT